MIRNLEEDQVEQHQQSKKLRVGTPVFSEEFEDECNNRLIESICKFGRTEKLSAMLSHEDRAAFCMLHLGSFLHSALLYKQEKIVDLLLDHNSGKDFDFYQTLMLIITVNSDQYLISDSYMDSRISKLVDAGLNAEHMTQVLRHNAQNDDGIKALLRNGADINIRGRNGTTALFFFFRGSSCFGDNMSNYATFRNHIRKLQIAGLPVSQDNLELFEEIQNKYEQGYLENYRLKNDPATLELEECRQECQELKAIKLNAHLSLHDIMFQNANQMAVLAGNENFRDIVLSKKFRLKFPMYGYLLKLQFRKGLLRRALFESALFTLPSMASKELTEVCSLEILKLLSDRDLKNLIKAYFKAG
ncbi:uncharacterized protein LOC106638654 [Copidosoma floridanum]|uniref:uncharacterized protein LOC106638654 n=1 Tax=Copidosoma floridanum TaxID=29053 RepID=UPI0006C951EB|nr:uncharacterized protein LOC106638654 [Copidosoma floridanum]